MHSVSISYIFFHLGNRLKKVTFLNIKSKGGMTATFSFFKLFFNSRTVNLRGKQLSLLACIYFLIYLTFQNLYF